MPLSHHPLRNPIISEQGRDTLATLMSALDDEMLRTIFTVSRIAEGGETIDGRLLTVDDWVRLFNKRRAEIEIENGAGLRRPGAENPRAHRGGGA
jgi:hypothetical protein